MKDDIIYAEDVLSAMQSKNGQFDSTPAQSFLSSRFSSPRVPVDDIISTLNYDDPVMSTFHKFLIVYIGSDELIGSEELALYFEDMFESDPTSYSAFIQSYF